MQEILIEKDVKVIAVIVEKPNGDIEAGAVKGITLEELKQAIERLTMVTRKPEENKN